MKAAQLILDYGGHRAVEKKEISIMDRTEEEIDARLKQLMKDEAIDAEEV
ncbi:MAG: hypothetical protein GQ474_00525 [Sulfurimonas sp.]|nr:hypothetical protein [Sulfurimonas sp.]